MTTRKLAQELARRIINTSGMTATDRDRALRQITLIAFDDQPIATATRRQILAALQVAVRDEQVWTALVAARDALGK